MCEIRYTYFLLQLADVLLTSDVGEQVEWLRLCRRQFFLGGHSGATTEVWDGLGLEWSRLQTSENIKKVANQIIQQKE